MRSNMRSKSFLQQQAYDYVQEKIFSGEFVPSTLYSETKLSTEIGISRTPIREALQCLSQDGYITIIPSKGFQIRELTERDMIESIQVRCAIEGFCTSEIANSIDSPKGKHLLADLRYILDEMHARVESAERDHKLLEEFIDFDHEFHLKLVKYVDNSEFDQLFQRLMYMIRLTSNTALAVDHRIKGTMEEHEAYYKALQEKDSHRAYSILIAHLLMPIQIYEQRRS